MRALAIVVFVACGGGSSVPEGPGAAIASLDCSRLGPDMTGFLIESQVNVALESQQAFTLAFEFPTADEPINRSDIYICGQWQTFSLEGGQSDGCVSPVVIGNATIQSETVSHSLAIEFPSPLPPPVTVNVQAKPLASMQSLTATIGTTDSETVSCD